MFPEYLAVIECWTIIFTATCPDDDLWPGLVLGMRIYTQERVVDAKKRLKQIQALFFLMILANCSRQWTVIEVLPLDDE